MLTERGENPFATEIDNKEGRRGYQHGHQHSARGRCPHIDAIKKKGCKAAHGNNQHPKKVALRGGNQLSIGGEKVQKLRAKECVSQREEYRQHAAPGQQQAHRKPQAVAIACPNISPHEAFACISEAVHNIAKEGEELHQERIDGQHLVANAAAGGCNEGKHHR